MYVNAGEIADLPFFYKLLFRISKRLATPKVESSIQTNSADLTDHTSF